MMIHDITKAAGRYKTRKRIGRGHGSGSGKTSGRGHKGVGSRAGHSHRPGFEGGQMPWARRLPKRGFSNSLFRTDYHVLNVGSLEAHFENGDDVDVTVLASKGLVRNSKMPLKILGEGELTKSLNITATKFSRSALEKIEGAGGSATAVPLKKWTRDRTKPTAKAARAARAKGDAADAPAPEAPPAEPPAQDTEAAD